MGGSHQGEHGWITPGEHGWITPGEHGWITPGDYVWISLGRLLTSQPPFGFRAIELVGDIANLVPKRPYLLEEKIHSQRLSVTIDKVQVFRLLIPAPLQGNCIGLFAWDDSSITFEGCIL